MSNLKIRTTGDVTQITVHGVADGPGVAAGLYSKLTANAELYIALMVATSCGSGCINISFVVDTASTEIAEQFLGTLKNELGFSKISHNDDIIIINLIGSGKSKDPKRASRAIQTLSGAGIKVDMVSTTENTIIIGITAGHENTALKALKTEFAKELESPE